LRIPRPPICAVPPSAWSTWSAAALVASVVAGGLWDLLGPQATVLAGALFTLAALAALPSVRRRERR
jgi:MYXO-CTERM domain-containing protein